MCAMSFFSVCDIDSVAHVRHSTPLFTSTIVISNMISSVAHFQTTGRNVSLLAR